MEVPKKDYVVLDNDLEIGILTKSDSTKKYGHLLIMNKKTGQLQISSGTSDRNYVISIWCPTNPL